MTSWLDTLGNWRQGVSIGYLVSKLVFLWDKMKIWRQLWKHAFFTILMGQFNNPCRVSYVIWPTGKKPTRTKQGRVHSTPTSNGSERSTPVKTQQVGYHSRHVESECKFSSKQTNYCPSLFTSPDLPDMEHVGIIQRMQTNCLIQKCWQATVTHPDFFDKLRPPPTQKKNARPQQLGAGSWRRCEHGWLMMVISGFTYTMLVRGCPIVG